MKNSLPAFYLFVRVLLSIDSLLMLYCMSAVVINVLGFTCLSATRISFCKYLLPSSIPAAGEYNHNSDCCVADSTSYMCRRI